MRNKSIFKSVIAIVLVIVSVFTFFGCSKDKTDDKDEQTLPNMVESKRWYYQQGFLNNWMVNLVGQDGHVYDENTGLLLQLVPTGVTVDDEGVEKSDGVAVEGVQYNVFVNKSEAILMTSSADDIIRYVMDEENDDFAFNTNNYIDAPRDAFMQNGEESESFTAKYSKLQFESVSYTFTKDGEDWQGIYNFITAKDKTYFIISYEAETSKFEEYKDDYLEIIGDFRKEGWETA